MLTAAILNKPWF